MLSKLTAVLATLFSLLFFIHKPVIAAPGTLDLSFGTNGVVSTDFDPSNPDVDAASFALATSIQPDGKIIAGGTAFTNGDYNFALARYNTDGSLDTTFGTGGKVTTSLGGSSEILALKLQSDGKIVTAGDVTTSSTNFAMVRYNTDGSLDTTFGTGGLVISDFGSNEGATAMVIDNDGKIILTGNQDGLDFILARYNTDGSLDTTFGTGGKTITDFSGNDNATSLLLQTNGKLIASGSDGVNFVLSRYNTDGSLDTTFGTGGKIVTDFGGGSNTSILQSDGKIMLAGQTNSLTADFALIRYNADGSLDTSFGTNGRVITDFHNNTTGEAIYAIGLQTDGKILATGTLESQSAGNVFALVRYQSNGALDTNFGTGGKVNTDFGNADEQAYAMVIQSDGQAVISGTIMNGDKSTFGLVRFNTSALENVVGTVISGGTITSDSEADGATNVDPVETTITSPTGGEVSISEITPSLQPPSGYTFLGSQVNITAPAATADNPLAIVFTMDASLLLGVANINNVKIFKNGTKINNCTYSTGVADPDPCIFSRLLLVSGDLEMKVLTSTASSWNFALETNTPPELSLTLPSGGQLYALGNVVSLQASFVDPGDSGVHTCTVNWDDGQISQGTVAESAGSGTCSAEHNFGSAGIYTINTVLTDSQGASGSENVMVVVYDPIAGFVTGGGWINSPAGAYTIDPNLAGVANFGFVSRYQKGANIPTGQTQFQFKVADFNFHSENYQWLVVAGAKAQYKGSGSVNGVSGYDFLLTATDSNINGGGDSDKFRIKITKDGQIIYDNALGASDDIDSANPQALGGGSIIIRK